MIDGYNKDWKQCTSKQGSKTPSCGKWKPLSEFALRNPKNGIYRNQCKECVSKYQAQYKEDNKEILAVKRKVAYKENSEKFKEVAKKYREDNKEILAQKGKIRYEKNREIILQKKKQLRKDNPEKTKEQDRKKYEKNKEKNRARAKAYAIKNTDKIQKYQKKYR